MPTTIRCTVVETHEQQTDTAKTYEAYDLLPWADPYIASLISSLEDDQIVSRRETQLLNSTRKEENTAHRFMSL